MKATLAQCRLIGLVAIALTGGVAMAGPMIYSEASPFGYAATMRLVVGLICGAIGAPMLVVAAWTKPTARAVASIYVPPTAAAILAALSWSDDYSFTHIAVPLSYVSVLLTFLILPDRPDAIGAGCPTCGYDRRGNPTGRCPECGADPPPVTDTTHQQQRRRRRQGRLRIAWVLLAMAASGAMHTILLRGLLSLG